MPPNIILPRNAKRITMAILIKLLATKIVANSFLGFSSSLVIMDSALEFWWSSGSISERVNEKSATSAPEINAEQNSNTNSRITLGIIE